MCPKSVTHNLNGPFVAKDLRRCSNWLQPSISSTFFAPFFVQILFRQLFFYICMEKKLPKWHSYEKSARKTLMILTQGLTKISIRHFSLAREMPLFAVTIRTSVFAASFSGSALTARTALTATCTAKTAATACQVGWNWCGHYIVEHGQSRFDLVRRQKLKTLFGNCSHLLIISTSRISTLYIRIRCRSR